MGKPNFLVLLVRNAEMGVQADVVFSKQMKSPQTRDFRTPEKSAREFARWNTWVCPCKSSPQKTVIGYGRKGLSFLLKEGSLEWTLRYTFKSVIGWKI